MMAMGDTETKALTESEKLVLALRARGVDATDVRHCVHEASHALDAKMRGQWSNTAVSAAMKRLGPGRAARSEILARAVEQVVCERLGVETKGLDHWVGISVMEAIKFHEPFLEYTAALDAAKRMMTTADVDGRVVEILAIAARLAMPSVSIARGARERRETAAPEDGDRGVTMANAHPKDEAIYARRNILHCKAVGALENAKAALKKLRAQKRPPPRWLVRALESIVTRAKPVADEMAKHRDEAW